MEHSISMMPQATAHPHPWLFLTFANPYIRFPTPTAPTAPAKIYAMIVREDTGLQRHQIPNPIKIIPVIKGIHQKEVAL